ncbi:hypothetical protein E2C01_084688 [Portunus trituberculatus]|uniref:Uncharacterized protein n=1 Tax=Portunus trituberculatus TaxID=210409 RepID=A0A5B7J4V2_PORTR|nr:hypothetical protein [Portunus trituberculatus]
MWTWVCGQVMCGQVVCGQVVYGQVVCMVRWYVSEFFLIAQQGPIRHRVARREANKRQQKHGSYAARHKQARNTDHALELPPDAMMRFVALSDTHTTFFFF